jgi:hypothetical protein
MKHLRTKLQLGLTAWRFHVVDDGIRHAWSPR